MEKKPDLSKHYQTTAGVYGARTARAVALLAGPEGQALARCRRGALFSLGLVAPGERARYQNATTPRSTLAFLDAFFDLAGASPDSAVDMQALQDRLELQRPTILNSVAQLMSAGLLIKT